MALYTPIFLSAANLGAPNFGFLPSSSFRLELRFFRRSNRDGLAREAGHPSKKSNSTPLQPSDRFSYQPIKRSALQLMVEFARFVVLLPGWRNGRR
jgi:hypothetical protein